MFRFEEIKKIHIELSTRCQAHCPSCPRNVMGGYEVPFLKHNTWSFEDFKEIIDKDLIKNLKQILFVGRYGDPMMCTDLVLILEYIYDINKNVFVNIHTNGGVQKEEWWKNLAKFEKLKVIFSIDGLEDTNHIYRRNVKWNKMYNNLKTFCENGGRAIWEFLVFGHNQHQIEDARKICDEINVTEFRIKRPYGFSSTNANISSMNVVDNEGKFEYNIFKGDEQYSNIPFDSEMHNTKPYNYPKEKYIQNIETRKRNQKLNKFSDVEIRCHSSEEKEIYIDALYNVYPCCWLGYGGQKNILHDLEEEKFVKWIEKNLPHNFINAKNNTLKDIINSKYFDDISKTFVNEEKFITCATMCGKNKNLRDGLVVKE